MYKKYASLILTAVFSCFISSCSMIATKEYLTKAEHPKIKNEKKIWVTTTDGVEYELSKPKIQDSVIVGTVSSADNMHREVKEIEISKIAFVKADEIDAGKVGLVTLGAVLSALFGIWLLNWVHSG